MEKAATRYYSVSDEGDPARRAYKSDGTAGDTSQGSKYGEYKLINSAAPAFTFFGPRGTKQSEVFPVRSLTFTENDVALPAERGNLEYAGLSLVYEGNRVKSALLGRDLNPLGRGDGDFYPAGAFGLTQVTVASLVAEERPSLYATGNSVNNAGQCGTGKDCGQRYLTPAPGISPNKGPTPPPPTPQRASTSDPDMPPGLENAAGGPDCGTMADRCHNIYMGPINAAYAAARAFEKSARGRIREARRAIKDWATSSGASTAAFRAVQSYQMSIYRLWCEINNAYAHAEDVVYNDALRNAANACYASLPTRCYIARNIRFLPPSWGNIGRLYYHHDCSQLPVPRSLLYLLSGESPYWPGLPITPTQPGPAWRPKLEPGMPDPRWDEVCRWLADFTVYAIKHPGAPVPEPGGGPPDLEDMPAPRSDDAPYNPWGGQPPIYYPPNYYNYVWERVYVQCMQEHTNWQGPPASDWNYSPYPVAR